MKRIGVVFVVALLAVGCAAVQQAKKDYDVGKTTPLTEGEVAPRAAAENLVEPIKPFLPTPLQPIAGVAIGILTVLGTFLRGRRLSKGLPTSANPITGAWGQKLKLETLVQSAATVSRGLEFGPEGSGVRRFSKILILGIIAIALLPPVQAFALAHPTEIGTILSALAALGGLEKELSKVLPVKSE